MTNGNEPGTTESVRTKKPTRAPGKPVVSLTELLAGETQTRATVERALAEEGLLDHLPGGETFSEAYTRLQRYLGYGSRSDGVPDVGSLTWLSLKSQLFTTSD